MEWRNPIRIEDCEEDSSSSSMSMYNLDSYGEDSYGLSNRSPTIVIHDALLPLHMEEVHSSPIMEKAPFERNPVIQKEDHPSSYNIEEIFGASTFNFHMKEVSQKRVRKVKKSDETLEEIEKDEVLFEKTNEDPVTVATTSIALTQSTAHNITVLNEKLLETES